MKLHQFSIDGEKLPNMAITTTEQMKAFLEKRDIPSTTIIPLSGGRANYVWRMANLDGTFLIIKHAEPFVASNAHIPFPVDRMDNEKTALTWAVANMQQHPNERIQVTVPALHRYFPDEHILVMDDVGARTLKDMYADPGLDMEKLGSSLGIWLAHLHSSTVISPFSNTFNSNTAKAIYRYSYSHLADTLARYGHEYHLGQRINETYGALLATDDVCICHGDFWPGNVLLSADDEGQTQAAIVDWEMVRRGDPATDVGQFAAEAWLLDHFKGRRDLLGAFLAAYRERSSENGKDAGFEERVAVQMGVHLAYWPTRVEWGSEEETKKVVALGVDILKHVIEGDILWVRREVWKGML